MLRLSQNLHKSKFLLGGAVPCVANSPLTSADESTLFSRMPIDFRNTIDRGFPSSLVTLDDNMFVVKGCEKRNSAKLRGILNVFEDFRLLDCEIV
jgi:hypothetical protein